MASLVPDTMRAALLTGYGGPEVLQVRPDVPAPVPGSDDVLIRVAACGINNTDINTRVGWYSTSVTDGTSGDRFDESNPDNATWGRGGIDFPRIQGADVCGEVVAAGSQAGASLVGRRVLVDPWVRDPEDPADRSLARYLGSEIDGGFAEYCVVPARNAHPVNSPLTDTELATFACSWSTAEHMLQRIDLARGQRIVVTGASGGVGSALVQLAAIRGAEVVAVASASKAEQVSALGAGAVVPRGDDTVARAVDATAGRIDAVADVVGGDDVGRWLGAIHPGGRFVTSGAIAGPVVEVDLRTLYLRDIEMIGATVVPEGVFADLLAHIEAGDVRPVLGGTWPLEQIHAAQDAFGTKQHVGSLAITL